MDKGHVYTDKQIAELEARLRKHYANVSKEARKRLTQYLKNNEAHYVELWRRLDEGEITEAQFEYLVMSDSELESVQGELVNHYVAADAAAMAIVGASLSRIYRYNSVYQGQRMERQLKGAVKLVNRLKRRKRMLPPPNPDKMKDRIWHRVKIRLVVSDGLKRGRNVYDIAENLERVTRMDLTSSYRAARTACTNAENQAKLEAMYVLRDEYGVDVKKQWYATLDDRTRTWHREMHGEVRELEEEFSNGLQYPGDPDGDPGEVWNCRCTLIDVIAGMDDIKDAPSGMSKEDWIKKDPVSKPYPIPKNRR